MNVAPRRLEAPVGLIDLMPTLLDVAGIATPPQCRGRSLAPVLRGEAAEDPGRAILVETGWQRALRTGQTKVLLGRNGDPTTLRYYDLVSDPGERHDLASPCTGRCRDDVRRLIDLERALVAPGDETAKGGGVTPEEIEELRALGYLND
jgi:arylsulfatase A-like enzyme